MRVGRDLVMLLRSVGHLLHWGGGIRVIVSLANCGLFSWLVRNSESRDSEILGSDVKGVGLTWLVPSFCCSSLFVYCNVIITAFLESFSKSFSYAISILL